MTTSSITTIGWYDREGKRYDLTDKDFIAKLFSDPHYRRLTNDKTSNGYWVSTVFLGLDHGLYGVGAPIVWETMVFPRCPKRWANRKKGEWRTGSSVFMRRYATEQEALAGHMATLSMVRDWPSTRSQWTRKAWRKP